MLRFQRMVAEQEHDGGECKQSEYTVAEHREGRVQLDPWIAPENVAALRGIPRTNRQRDERQGRREQGGKITEQAVAKRNSDDEIKRNRRPGDKLKDLKLIAERTAGDGT